MFEKIKEGIVKNKIEEVVAQGGQSEKIETLFEQIIQSAINEYTEDNSSTLRFFMEERFSNACDKSFLK